MPAALTASQTKRTSDKRPSRAPRTWVDSAMFWDPQSLSQAHNGSSSEIRSRQTSSGEGNPDGEGNSDTEIMSTSNSPNTDNPPKV